MAVAHVAVGIPQHGRGAHPESLSLALDGRGRTCIAQKVLCLTRKSTWVPCAGWWVGPPQHLKPTWSQRM